VRRIATWVLVAAVVALGAAAGVDALRGGGEPPRAEPPSPAPSTTQDAPGLASPEDRLTAALREAGIDGVLEYADEDCDTHAVSLPDLSARPSGVGGACSFAGSLNERGGYAVECSGGRVKIQDPVQAPYADVHADCSPAWKPDGIPTLLRGGEVVEAYPCPDRGIIPMRCSHTLLSRNDLARELHGAGWTGAGFAVEELVWLSDTRAAAIVTAGSAGDRGDLLAVFDGRRLLTESSASYDGLAALRVSPSRTFVAAQIGDPGGVVVVDRDGALVRPLVRHGSALAWSPDERWIAEATEEGVYIFPADGGTPRVYVLSIVARDLVWR
jgi:hypothetical protein